MQHTDISLYITINSDQGMIEFEPGFDFLLHMKIFEQMLTHYFPFQ